MFRANMLNAYFNFSEKSILESAPSVQPTPDLRHPPLIPQPKKSSHQVWLLEFCCEGPTSATLPTSSILP